MVSLSRRWPFNLSIQFFLVGLLIADLYVDGWDRIPSTWQMKSHFDTVVVSHVLVIAVRVPIFGPFHLAGSLRGRVQGTIDSTNSPRSGDHYCWRYVLQHLPDASDHYISEQLLRCAFISIFCLWLAVSLALVAPASIVIGAI